VWLVGSSNESGTRHWSIKSEPLSQSPSYLLGRNVGLFLKGPGKQKSGHDALEQEILTMGKKLYVGNLAYSVTNAKLEEMFAPHGTVESAEVIMDRATGRSKGFGFVEMSSPQEAQAAISALDGQETDGRAIKVNEAKPRENRGGGGGGRGGYGGGRSRY
jgi:cold-inducible RNA-binding protein